MGDGNDKNGNGSGSTSPDSHKQGPGGAGPMVLVVPSSQPPQFSLGLPDGLRDHASPMLRRAILEAELELAAKVATASAAAYKFILEAVRKPMD